MDYYTQKSRPKYNTYPQTQRKLSNTNYEEQYSRKKTSKKENLIQYKPRYKRQHTIFFGLIGWSCTIPTSVQDMTLNNLMVRFQ